MVTVKLNVRQLVLIIVLTTVVFAVGSVAGMYVSSASIGIFDENTSAKTSGVNEYPSSTMKSTIDRTLDGVVTVYVAQDSQLASQGSGFIYRDDYIMTNEHVVGTEDSSNVTYYVQYSEGEWSKMNLVGGDVDTDIAVGEPDKMPGYARNLELSDETPDIGTRVVALGSPSGLQNSVTSGIVSATERSVLFKGRFSIPDTIQTDAALNRGNSGGPLVSLEDGDVVGVNRAKEGDNIGFAVSSRMADRVGKSLIQNGEHSNPFVGISTIQLNPTRSVYDEVDVKSGVIVVGTTKDTPGEEKFSTGTNESLPDIIVGIEDREVSDNEDISGYLLSETEPGDTVTFKVYRDGEIINVDVALTSRSKVR
jgi:S1-C subfamily serine protease